MDTRRTRTLLSLILLAPVGALGACGALTGEDPEDPGDETVIIDTNINEDRTLTDIFEDPEIADYRVTRANLRISRDVDVVVEPGVRIEFVEGASWDVQGSLSAVGTAEQPIVFTGEDASPGAWIGLIFTSADPKNELDHVVVEYGGQMSVAGANAEFNVALKRDARAKITNTTMADGAGHGLTTFTDADLTGFAANTLARNAEDAIFGHFDSAHFYDAGSTFTGNGEDVILLEDAPIDRDVTWSNPGVPFRLTSSGMFRVNAGLTISPGATIEMSPGTQLLVLDGFLNAVGTAAEPITFTGVDKVAGAWDVIKIDTPSPNNVFDHCVVEFGGAQDIAGLGAETLIGVSGDDRLTITNSTLRGSQGWGIWASPSATLTQSDNTFENNALGDIEQ